MQHSMAYRAGKARARRGIAGCGLRWLAALLLAVGMVGPAWASCDSTVELSVPAGGSIALNCPIDGGVNYGFYEVDTSNSYTTTYGHVSLVDPAHDIFSAGYFNTSGAGQTDEFDLTDGSVPQTDNKIVHFIIHIGTAGITLDPASLPNPTIGVAYSQSVTASGGTGPYTFSVTSGALPTGLSLASNGTLSGTPSASGTFSFTVQAQDTNSQVGTRAYTLTVSRATLTLTPSTLPDGTIGAAYSQSFSTTGGVMPYSYAITAGALPAGLTLASSGTLSGTPTAGGTFNFDVRVSDSSGGTPSTATVSYALVIDAPTITVSPATLPAGQLNSAYSATLSAGGGTAPYSFAVSAGALPAGLSLASDGTLSGTPTAFGTFNFSVSATDSSTGTGPYSASRAYTLTIADMAVVANPVAATVAYGSGANPITLNITGGTPTAVAIGTAASHGSAAASGTSITYQPAAGFAGSDSFTYTASNGGGPSAPATVSITVNPPTLSLTPAAGTLTLDYSVAYSQAFGASGGAAPYSYVLTGTLPAGLSFAAASGTLSGAPTQSGSFPVTVTATDSSTGSGAPFSVANNYTLQVNPATVAITPATLPAGTAGSGYSQSFAASGGIGPYTFSVVAGGALPTGLSLADDGTLSGTPSANGTFAFTVQAQDANDQIGTRAYSLTVSGATLTLAPSTLPDGAIGAAYSQSFSTTGGIAPYSYAITAGVLPAGLSLASSGALSGTPTAGGTFNFDVRASDSSGGTPSTATVSYALVIAAPTITLSPATLPAGQLNSAYSATTISAGGGTAPYSFAVSAGTLPAGLSLASDGTLSGTPTAFGTFNFSVSATDSSTGTGPYSASRAYTLTIADMAVVANPVAATVAYGSGANPITLNITGGTPTAVAIGTAASHGSAAASGTSITYQPAAGFAGSDSFTYTASNASGTSAPATVSITVSPPMLSLTPAAGTLTLDYNVAYSQAFSASGGAAPYSYVLTGTLPAGLSFAAASGTLSGKPTQSGSFPVTVIATDSSTGSGAPFSVTNNYTLQVNPATLAITPASLPAGTAGSGYSQSFAASGGIGPYTFSVVAGGALPTGLSLADDGTLSGTPSANGTFAFTVQAQDAHGQVGTRAYDLTIIVATLTLVPATLPPGVGSVPYSQSFSTTGGVAPYSYALTAGALPAGLTLAADGRLSGTPTASGTFHFDVQVSDSSGGTTSSATVSYALTIAAPTITLTPPELPAGIIGTPYAQTLSASGGVAPYSYAISAGALPGGVVLATDGRLSGTLTASGRFAFTVRAQDANGFSGTRDYSLVIEVRSDPSKDPEVLGVLTAQTTATRRFAQAQIGNFQQRLESLHGGGGAGFANGFTVPIERPCQDTDRRGADSDCGRMMFPNARPLVSGPLPAAAPTPALSPTASSSGPFGLWTGGALRFGDYDARHGGHAGFEFETTGISLGADYRTGPTFTFGGGIGYGHDKTDIGNNGSRSDADSYSVAMYASYHPGKHVYLDGLLGYQWLAFQSRRYVTDNGNRVHGKRDGTQWFVSASGGYETRLERLGIASYARLDLARATIDGYTEQGDDTYDLSYRSQDIETVTTSLGMRLDYQYQISWGMLSPQLRLEYQHDFQDESIAAMQYADLVGPLYRAGIQGLARNRVLIGIGARLYTVNDFGLRVEYSDRFSNDSTSEQAVLLNIEKRF